MTLTVWWGSLLSCGAGTGIAGSCLSGAAISDGMVFWGSGYTNSNFGTANNKVYAFGLP